MVLEAPDMAQKILIVDDEQEVLSMLRRCFLLEGYEVITLRLIVWVLLAWLKHCLLVTFL